MKKLFLIPLILFSLISLPSLSDNKNKIPVCKEGLVLSGNKCIKLPDIRTLKKRGAHLELQNGIYYDKLTGLPYTGFIYNSLESGLMMNGQKCGTWKYFRWYLITERYNSCNKIYKKN